MISLLWKNENDVMSEVNDTVFTDLKIRKLFDHVYDAYSDADEVIDVMSKIPSKETIKYRQEILTDFLNDKENRLNQLYYSLVNLTSSYINYMQSPDLIKRQILLFMYLYNFYNFLDDVKGTIKEINGKSECFLNIVSIIDGLHGKNEVIKLRKKMKGLYDDISNCLNFTATYRDGAPHIKLEFVEKETLEDDLYKVIKGFDIKQFKTPKSIQRKEISTTFLREIVLNDINVFKPLKEFYEENRNIPYLDLEYLLVEYRYYLNLKDLIENLGRKGIPCTKAEISETDETIINNGYDITLSISNIDIVPNDFVVSNNEHMIFILGVNSGGKTCFLRSAGINYLFFLTTGYVFADKAKIYPVDYLFTHFPNEENYQLGEGRLKDELKRIDEMKEVFSNKVIAFFNETFSSTNEDKACDLTNDLIKSVRETKAKMLFVTHQYRIFEQTHDEGMVFLSPQVVEGAMNERTHKIIKVEKRLLSYANDILYKYGLSKEQLENKKRRLENE